jgi:hypothetical protein
MSTGRLPAWFGRSIVCIACAAILFMSCAARERIGGLWEISSSMWPVSHGSRQERLLRRGLLVDEVIATYRVYPDDCIIYGVFREKDQRYYGACGDHVPTLLTNSDFDNWTLTDYGMVPIYSTYVIAAGKVIRRSATFPFPYVRRLALRQPLLTSDWRSKPDGAPLAPVLVDVPVAVDDRDAANLHRTPLIQAAAEGRIGDVNALLASGADPSAYDDHRITGLLLASQNGFLDVVEALLRAGASVDAADDRGMTALMLACRDGREEVVARLLAAGADPRRTDAKGNSALTLATGSRNADVIELLRKYAR